MAPAEEEIRQNLAAKRYREAFERLLGEYQHKVFRLAWSMLGNEALAEDTAQEIFIRVWKALPGFRAGSSVSTWLYAIARNACLTAAKANTRRSTFTLEQARSMAARERPAPDERLRDMVARLPEKYRQVITLFHMEERSYEEVARMLGMPMGTVKTCLHRARKELAAAFARDRIVKGAR
jgi:RNA polymerase sigma-70 factor, ECF subfamily